jgi:catechol 2,3-dioxygenase-like lactoylglutathione lyase family enzyme
MPIMLKNAQTFSSFSVNDLQAAKRFYAETLGLDLTESEEGLAVHLPGGAELFIYPKRDHVAATFTVLNFKVENIDQTVDELTAKGIQFERYDTPHFKTDAKGIARGGEHAPTIAWFKDPAGNFVSVIQRETAASPGH